MSEQSLILKQLSSDLLDAWLSISASPTAEARDRLLADMSENLRRQRFLVFGDGEPVATFAVDFGEIGGTTWKPRIKSGLPEDKAREVFSIALHTVTSASVAEGLRYVETSIRGGRDLSTSWRQALRASGFRNVASKREWTVRDTSYPHVERGIKVRRARTAEASVLASLFRATVIDSADRTSVYEVKMGEPIGDADAIFVANVERNLAGICVCLHEAGTPDAWIKYVGTAPAFRRRGVARSLLQEAFHQLSFAGVRRFHSLIDIRNRSSTSLHRALGFGPSSAFGDFYYKDLQ
ncbi:UNVERIFIED_ORG: GNAT superfamily N-acetyltransferase [Agrobacterium larrymoorei]|nr:GNAT superfamily N-acetyltransferase [Agrobacterium larrymoorei]